MSWNGFELPAIAKDVGLIGIHDGVGPRGGLALVLCMCVDGEVDCQKHNDESTSDFVHDSLPLFSLHTSISLSSTGRLKVYCKVFTVWFDDVLMACLLSMNAFVPGLHTRIVSLSKTDR